MNLKEKLQKHGMLLRAFCIIVSVYLASCHGYKDEEQMTPYQPAATVRNMPIMGNGKASFAQLENFFLKYNHNVNKTYLDNVTKAYLIECRKEGVNSDVAFVQMCHETNFLRFGNQVKLSQNNFAGIGATDNGATGLSFKSIDVGVRAQVQHLKAYASKARLNGRLVDPRFDKVKRGSAVYVSQLGRGKWASDPNYANKLLAKLNELYSVNGI